MTEPGKTNNKDAPERRVSMRRLSLTSLAGKDIQASADMAEERKGKAIDRAVTVRRRSIVAGVQVERDVQKKLLERPNNELAKALQTPLASAVQMLGSIMHIDDLPKEVHDKVEKVLTILGEPESLLVVKMSTDNKTGMDKESKEWYKEFLEGAQAIDDDDFSETARSEDSTIDEEVKQILTATEKVEEDGNTVDNSAQSQGSENHSDGRTQRKTHFPQGRKGKMYRKRAMKAAMSDITPSDIVNSSSESESESGSDSGSDDDPDKVAEFLQRSAAAGRASDDSPEEDQAEGLKPNRWSLIRSTMTPLMRWIAMGKQRRVGVDNEKANGDKRSKRSNRSKRSSRGKNGSFKRARSDVHRKSLRELAGGPAESGRSPGIIQNQILAAEKKDRERSRSERSRSPKSPQMLEISIPQMRDMQDETIQPLQKFFEAQHFDAWHFNVFELEKLTKNHSLWFLGMILLEHYKIVDIFQIDQGKLSNFLLNLEENYCYDKDTPNPYHNHIHAADVLQTVAHFSTCGPIQKRLRVIHGFALFVAAMGHDYKHPGRTNAFLIHTQNEIAITYNDMSVLENFHAASLFKVLMEDNTNILSGMDNKELRTFRNMCVKTILATDLATGFEYVGLFKSHVTTGHAFDSEESKLLLISLIMKVADVSHPCKQWEVHAQWSELISNEFFLQGDLEMEKGMPISPLCDRSKHHLPKSQCDFVDYVVRPCVDVFSEYCKSDLWKNTMQENYDRWKGMI